MFLKKRMENIKRALAYKRITQKALSKKLKMSESYITRLINGERYNREFEIFIYYELGVSYRNFK